MRPPLQAALLTATLLAGCSNEPRPTGGGVPSATASATAAPLVEASWRGAPLPFRSALSFSRGGRALHLTLSTHEITCAQLREAVEMLPGEVAFDLTLAPLLKSDGSESWAITRVRFGKVTRQGKLGSVKLDSQSPLESLHAELDLTASFPPDRLVLRGTVPTTACGVLPWSSGTQPREQPNLALELAGKPFVVRGASLAADGTKLSLSTEPHFCGTTVGSDLAVELTLTPEGDLKSVRAEGYLLPTTLSKILGAEDPPMRVRPAAGEVTTKLDLDGQLMLGSYRLGLSGSVDAERCPAVP
jgi:hypothetical protein